MACAVSGAYLGIDAIPEWWRNKVENLRAVENLAGELWKKHESMASTKEGRSSREPR
jgi:ADP-ribosylglycohydrolase